MCNKLFSREKFLVFMVKTNKGIVLSEKRKNCCLIYEIIIEK